MSKIVARMEKMKLDNLMGIQKHNQREQTNHSNKDIDVARSNLNYDLINQTPINYKQKVMAIINNQRTSTRAIRKDAVLVDEWIITSDTDFFKTFQTTEDIQQFFQDSVGYFQTRCGSQNIVYATVHLDETTPHMHMGIIPMKKGRLTSKEVFSRQALKDIQDELPKYLQEKGYSIERGTKGSKQKNLTVPEYKEMQKELQSFEWSIDQHEKLLDIKIKELKEAETDVTDLVAHKEMLKTEQDEIVQSLQETVFPDLENIKEKKFSINGQKYILSDNDLQTIKSIASDLNALKSQNKAIKLQKKELEQDNFRLKKEVIEQNGFLKAYEEELTNRETQLDDITAKQYNYDHSEQLSNNLKQKEKQVIELEQENKELTRIFHEVHQEKENYREKYNRLKEKFDGLTTYLHEKANHSKEWILQAISEGIQYIKNKPKIKNHLDFYTLEKQFYIDPSGKLFTQNNTNSKQATVILNPKFTPTDLPILNKSTGFYEFVGEYQVKGVIRKNTLYLSEEDILANKPFSFANSSDKKIWENNNQQKRSFSQNQEWSR